MKEMDQLPGLLKQGKEALGACIIVVFKLYQRNYNENNQSPKNFEYLEKFIK